MLSSSNHSISKASPLTKANLLCSWSLSSSHVRAAAEGMRGSRVRRCRCLALISSESWRRGVLVMTTWA